MKKSNNLSKYFLFSIVLLLAGCFEERSNKWELELLEWSPPDRSTNALSLNVELEAEQTETETISLQMQYAGGLKAEDITGTFTIDEGNSSATEGTHFEFVNDSRSVTIPAGSSSSEEIEITILSEAFDRGDEHNIVLLITSEGDVAPMENYKEFNILIQKETGYLEAMEVTLDDPGFNAGYRLLDATTGNTYSSNEANDDTGLQQVVDFGLWNSSVTEFTMIVPTDDGRLGGWGSGRTIRDEWTHKNDGILMKLPYDPSNEDLFDNILLEEDVEEAYNQAEQQLADMGHDPNDYGPGGHLQYVSQGELIFFQSIDRDFYAVLYVIDIAAGGSGHATYLMKTTAETE